MALIEVRELSDDQKEAIAQGILEQLHGLSESDAEEIINTLLNNVKENLIVGKVLS